MRTPKNPLSEQETAFIDAEARRLMCDPVAPISYDTAWGLAFTRWAVVKLAWLIDGTDWRDEQIIGIQKNLKRLTNG